MSVINAHLYKPEMLPMIQRVDNELILCDYANDMSMYLSYKKTQNNDDRNNIKMASV